MRLSVIAAILLCSLPARASESFGGWSYYLGDLHTHTGWSGDAGASDLGNCPDGGCGAYADVFTTARANGLDFVALTDHVNGNSTVEEDEFLALQEDVNAAHDPAHGFVTLPAAELALHADGVNLGHKNLYFFEDASALRDLTLEDARLGTGRRTVVKSCAALWDDMQALAERFGPVLLLPHHPAVVLPAPTSWTCHDEVYQPAVEVHSEHGNSLYPGIPYDPPWSGTQDDGTVHAALDVDGYALRLGFVGGTDAHDTLPGETCTTDVVRTDHPYGGGLTIAVLEDGEAFDRRPLYDAVVARRTMATTGPLLPFIVGFESGGAPLGGLGETLGLPAGQPLDVGVRVPLSLRRHVVAVQLFTPDGPLPLEEEVEATWGITLAAGEVPPWMYVGVAIDGDSWWGGNCADGGATTTEWIWASPSWTEDAAADLDADGVAWADGDCDDGDPRIGPGLDEVWYDGVDQDCDGNDDDRDADGVAVDDDCDDGDAARAPGIPEVWYDGIDQDCDGNDDDQDGDGVAVDDDCDDDDATVSPLAVEQWYDGVDQDCDGRDDDQDDDGVDVAADCDDTVATVYPGAVETWYDGVDQDCDGNDDDRDGDGWRHGRDCDDADDAVFPGVGGLGGDCLPAPPRGRTCGPPYRGRAPLALALAATAALGRRRRPVG